MKQQSSVYFLRSSDNPHETRVVGNNSQAATKALSYAETVRAEAQAKIKQILGTETSSVYKSLKYSARTSNVCGRLFNLHRWDKKRPYRAYGPL